MTQPYPLTGTLPTPDTRKRLPLRLRSNGLLGSSQGPPIGVTGIHNGPLLENTWQPGTRTRWNTMIHGHMGGTERTWLLTQEAVGGFAEVGRGQVHIS
jgi:hypothetical protein